jgi:hypothetical protein
MHQYFALAISIEKSTSNSLVHHILFIISPLWLKMDDRINLHPVKKLPVKQLQ